MYFLSMRGYSGRLKFDHDAETLSIKVQPDSARTDALQGRVAKDTKTLSGGERSFATVSFLLALWEAMECPFRCLDEFDVFMDAVNRRISMKLLIDTARETHSRQYILMTPQDMRYGCEATLIGPY